SSCPRRRSPDLSVGQVCTLFSCSALCWCVCVCVCVCVCASSRPPAQTCVCVCESFLVCALVESPAQAWRDQTQGLVKQCSKNQSNWPILNTLVTLLLCEWKTGLEVRTQ